ncbi:MAG: hypothetical protein V4488_07270 [Pseudomonadota bacterium]
MANLILKEFRCVEETDEAGADSPYFVVFVGHPGKPESADVKMIRKGEWDNEVSTGDLLVANVPVASGVDTNTLVLVALMEEDVNPDIAGTELSNVRNWMKAVFQAFGSINGASAAQLSPLVMPEFIKALNANLTNDDVVGISRLSITTASGLLPLINFFGDGGQYKVRFNMA